MWTVAEVARKAKVKKARVRYFARNNNVQKITIKNVDMYIFDKTDYQRFLDYLGIGEKTKDDYLQLKLDLQYHTKITSIKENKKSELERLLKTLGNTGVRREELCMLLKVKDSYLETLLCELTYKVPIAEDDRVDDKIYWVKKRAYEKCLKIIV